MKSIQAIKFYQGPEINIEEITDEYEAEMATNKGCKGTTIKDVFGTNHLKWPFSICLVAEFSSRMGGFDIENFYSTDIIYSLGVSLDMAAIFNVFILRFPSIIFMLISLVLVKRLKSRPYLLVTLVGGLTCITLLFLAQVFNHFNPESKLSAVFGVTSLFVGITSWNFGSGFLPKFLPGECCPQISRALTTTYQFGVRGVTAIIITVIYPPLVTVIGGPIALLPVMISGYVSVGWLWKYLPETKDKSVDEVVRQWIEPGSPTLITHQNDKKEKDLRKSYGTTE